MSKFVCIVAWNEKSGATFFQSLRVDCGARRNDNVLSDERLSHESVGIVFIDSGIDPRIYAR